MADKPIVFDGLRSSTMQMIASDAMLNFTLKGGEKTDDQVIHGLKDALERIIAIGGVEEHVVRRVRMYRIKSTQMEGKVDELEAIFGDPRVLPISITQVTVPPVDGDLPTVLTTVIFDDVFTEAYVQCICGKCEHGWNHEAGPGRKLMICDDDTYGTEAGDSLEPLHCPKCGGEAMVMGWTFDEEDVIRVSGVD